MKNSIFFGEKGITSTSANHISNMAKEFYSQLEMRLAKIEFFNTSISLLGDTSQTRLSNGISNTTEIPQMIEDIYQCKTLIAWLREAIKAKDKMLSEAKSKTLYEFATERGIELLPTPRRQEYPTEQDYLETLSIKDRFTFFDLETKLACLGQAIHPSGTVSNARLRMEHALNNPIETTGSGRDTVLYCKSLSVSKKEVEDCFFTLQNAHRELQAQLNNRKHTIQQWIEQKTAEIDTQYRKELIEYNNQQSEVAQNLKMYIDNKVQEISAMKIILPKALEAIYSKINSLGK